MRTPTSSALACLAALVVLAPAGAALVPQPAHAAHGEAVYTQETLEFDSERTRCEGSPVTLTATPSASGGWDVVLARAPTAATGACRSPVLATWLNVADGSPERGFHARASRSDACEVSTLHVGPAASNTPFTWHARHACDEAPRVETMRGVLEFETYSVTTEGAGV